MMRRSVLTLALACSTPALTATPGVTVTAPLLFLCAVHPPGPEVMNHGCMQIRQATHVVATGPAFPMADMAVLFAASAHRAAPIGPRLRYVGTYLCSRKERPECLPVEEFAVDTLHPENPDKIQELMGIDEAYALLNVAPAS